MDEYLNHLDQIPGEFQKILTLSLTSWALEFPGDSNVQKSLRTIDLVMKERSGKAS